MAKIDKSKGTIYIHKTKKGFAAVFETESGKKLPLSSFKPDNDSLNGIQGELSRIKGKPVKLITDKGQEVFSLIAESQTENVASTNNRPPMRDSFDIAKTLLPIGTQKALASVKNPDNFYLKLCKGARYDEDRESGEKKFFSFKSSRSGSGMLVKANYGNVNFQAINHRHNHVISSLGFTEQEDTLVRFSGTAIGRWVIGLGNTSVYENGMTLHHVFGIPYIPASSIKGMLRTWVINECFGFEEDSEQQALKNRIFQRIFGFGNSSEEDAENEDDGEGGQKGEIYFFDAFPTGPIDIEPDVMNNHYQSYYEGKTPPGDWINPNPIFFLTARNGSFIFNLGARKSSQLPLTASLLGIEKLTEKFEDEDPIEHMTLLSLTFKWLKDALAYNGVGAKTAIGYGRIRV